MICIPVIFVYFAISDDCWKQYETNGNKVKAEEDFPLKITKMTPKVWVPNQTKVWRKVSELGPPNGKQINPTDTAPTCNEDLCFFNADPI